MTCGAQPEISCSFEPPGADADNDPEIHGKSDSEKHVDPAKTPAVISSLHCDVCDKSFGHINETTPHLKGKLHLKNARAFKAANQLRQRFGLSEDDLKKCPVCHTTFKSTYSAITHFKDSGCLNRYVADPTREALNPGYYYQSNVPDSSNFGCHICNMQFSSQSALESHEFTKKHNEILQRLQFEWALKTQFKLDDLGLKYCSTCKIELCDTKNAFAHYNGFKHQKKMKPTITVVENSDILTTNRIFHCPPCNKRFATANELNSHIAGKKHQRIVECEKAKEHLRMALGVGEDDMEYCKCCMKKFNSPLLAKVHYRSIAHKACRKGKPIPTFRNTSQPSGCNRWISQKNGSARTDIASTLSSQRTSVVTFVRGTTDANSNVDFSQVSRSYSSKYSNFHMQFML